jgi:hypothetical protein
MRVFTDEFCRDIYMTYMLYVMQIGGKSASCEEKIKLMERVCEERGLSQREYFECFARGCLKPGC